MAFPFDTANAILNTARSRVNDLILTPTGQPSQTAAIDPQLQQTQVGGGTLLQELNADGSITQRTQIIFNSAYRKLQKYLADLGYRLLIKPSLIVVALPANINPDPAALSFLSWNGFFDGTNQNITPALPTDFYAPLKVFERVSGQNSIFIPMRCALDGINTSSLRTILQRQWEWASNKLFLPGATGLTDLKFRYISYLPDLPDPAFLPVNTPWYYQTVPIVGCLSALAWYIAYEVCFPRGDEPGAAQVLANAEDEANKIFNDQARADQRTNCRRIPRGGNMSRHGYRFGL